MRCCLHLLRTRPQRGCRRRAGCRAPRRRGRRGSCASRGALSESFAASGPEPVCAAEAEYGLSWPRTAMVATSDGRSSVCKSHGDRCLYAASVRCLRGGRRLVPAQSPRGAGRPAHRGGSPARRAQRRGRPQARGDDRDPRPPPREHVADRRRDPAPPGRARPRERGDPVARERSERLENALRPPKARGGFGELLLENLLRDRLPPSAFALQYGFAGGERVDAVIKVDRLVPIDSKFPLDNFERMLSAENDIERQQHEKLFGRDVKNHVDAIASKYIRPDEGTYDFAFMYLPSEAIYYELTCGKTGALLEYAHGKRVVPVSPTTLTAYLQVIVLGLKGLQIEKHADEIMAKCARLQTEFGKFKEDFELVGTHLDRAQKKFLESEKHLGKFETKLDQAAESPAELTPPAEAHELPRAVDSASR